MAKKGSIKKRGSMSHWKLYTRLYCTLAYKVRYINYISKLEFLYTFRKAFFTSITGRNI